jgi:subtilisin family serine protease
MSLRHILLLMLLIPLGVSAQNASELRDAGSLGAIRLAGSEDPNTRKVYIVQLAMPSAADHHASLLTAAAKPGAKAVSRVRFDKASPVIQSYTARLSKAQEQVIARAGSGTELIYSFRFGLNGFAAKMHPAQAHKLESLPEVLHVWEDEIRPLATNYSLDFLELFDRGKGLRGAPGLDGEDIIIGVIDSGIAPEHPALEDTKTDQPRQCQGDWAENTFLGQWLCRRFKKREDILVFEPPVDWNGACIAGEDFEDTACNNKLIGARYFVAGAEASGPIDDGEIRSARDADGHGTHTATTAAGNRVKASIFGSFIDRVEGIAPRARIAVYKAMRAKRAVHSTVAASVQPAGPQNYRPVRIRGHRQRAPVLVFKADDGKAARRRGAGFEQIGRAHV